MKEEAAEALAAASRWRRQAERATREAANARSDAKLRDAEAEEAAVLIDRSLRRCRLRQKHTGSSSCVTTTTAGVGVQQELTIILQPSAPLPGPLIRTPSLVI